MSKPAPPVRSTHDSRPLLDRVLETPHLERVVPRLPAEALLRLIERCGLEDCANLVALATPEQVTRVFDLDLWRSDRAGLDEHFTAERFGVWLEVLVEPGPDAAAATLAQIDPALLTAAFAQYLRVFDPATVSPTGALADDALPADAPGGGLTREVGGYLLVARRADAWDAVTAVLVALDAGHHAAFHHLMRGCRSLSNSDPEVDGLDELLTEPRQVMFDLAAGRSLRREGQGYATPAEARAFLTLARTRPARQMGPSLGREVVSAYFRALDESARDADADLAAPASEVATQLEADAASSVATFVDLLVHEGVLPQPPRALLAAPEKGAASLARMHALLQDAHDRDPAAYAAQTRSLAFLANTLLAGGSVLARPFTVQEASDAAVAVCNLGLENWPTGWPAISMGTDLVSAFEVGWHVLHEQVCLTTTDHLVSALKGLVCADRTTRAEVAALRKALTQQRKAGTPWLATEAMEVLTGLDMTASVVLPALIAECPVLHAGLRASQRPGSRTVSASAFEFISENSQIAAVRTFLAALPVTLAP